MDGAEPDVGCSGDVRAGTGAGCGAGDGGATAS